MNRVLLFLLFILALFSSTNVIADEAAQSDHIPWSGWWWPDNVGSLATGDDYRGSPAPLEKYDLVTSDEQQGPATTYYLTNRYDADAQTWEGLCDAWSAASILEDIDFAVSTISNLYFYIGDKKGLVTLAYERSFNTGVAQTSTSPLVFHKWLQNYIRDAGVPFYADLDCSTQSWNYPIFEYSMDITDMGDETYVSCTIWYADDGVDPDYSGTKVRTRAYEYTLYNDGTGYSGGEWGLDNTSNHPEILNRPAEAVAANPYLDYDTIKNIAESVDDAIESDLAVALNPGMYNLILMNKDQYIVDAEDSDTAYIEIERLDDTDEYINIEITDAAGDSIYTGTITETKSIPLDYGTPPYDVVLSKDGYDNPGLYRIQYDVRKNFEFVRPKTQKGYGWGGYALVNTSEDTISDIIISGYTDDGTPLDSFIGPFSLNAGEKKVVLTSDFSYRNQIEKENFYGIKIQSPENLSIVNLSGSLDSHMALVSSQDLGTKLIIPAYPQSTDFSEIRNWGVYNPWVRSAQTTMTLYSESGDEEESVDVEISPIGINHYGNSDGPFESSTGNGWVSIESNKDISCYQEWLSSRSDFNDVLPGLIPGLLFYLPNISVSGGWDTTITLINTSENENQVSFQILNPEISETLLVRIMQPFEKIEIDAADLFSGYSNQQVTASSLKITSDSQIAGYYTYTASGSSEFMAIPLSAETDIKRQLTLPHVASGDGWWTGVNLFNPGSNNSVLNLLPYDSTGLLLEAKKVMITLEKNQKLTTLLSDIFDLESGSAIDYVRIEVEEGSAVFGTYGYGYTGMKMLAASRLN